MNFFKYQNIPMRSANIEVPLISDPRTNVFESLYSQSNDELWIDSWLQQNSVYKQIPKVKFNKGTSRLCIRDAQKSLRQCLILLEKLTKSQQELHDNVATMSSMEWKQKTIEIGTTKDQFTRLMSKFESGDAISALKRSLDKRKKKRLRERKRKLFYKQELHDKYENRKKLHKSIDEWLRNMKEEADKAKMEEDMQKDADCVLAEVTKKKQDARKQLSLVSSLMKLRTVRDQIAKQRGEKVPLEDRQAFNVVTEKLVRMWESCLKTYTTEEQGLRLMIEKTASEDSKMAHIAKERKLLEEWHTIFFGPRQVISQDNHTYWALTAAERDMETFVAIRKSWDTFLVPPSNEMGSKIPVGWVLPDLTTSENWTKYLTTS
ncbi:hypothetical protein NQ315_011436 [Exocentrus adspersus]|uniref:Programmed cell death protein 7 n=1 Tax=Exocentrus adspersus TaxID=1586481 RepID=A0AAV8VUE3_9CUCU|nr:hypothetical protein NQ315_011436 [Exocentrus adspersus]